MSISYIIATYSGMNHTSNKEFSEEVLDCQLKQLLKLLHSKKVSEVPNLIREIIISVPPVSPENQFPNYYRWSEWATAFSEFPEIRFVQMYYKGENKHHSYDQWIQGCLSSGCEYNLLIQDDYCLDPNNLTVDIDLIDLYNEEFPKKVGYLCSSAPRDHPQHGYHAAISNGLVSRKTIQFIPNILQRFYSYNEYSQLAFSHLFINYGVLIEDYRKTHKVLFYNSMSNVIEDHSLPECSSDQHIFIPIQFFLM